MQNTRFGELHHIEAYHIASMDSLLGLTPNPENPHPKQGCGFLLDWGQGGPRVIPGVTPANPYQHTSGIHISTIFAFYI